MKIKQSKIDKHYNWLMGADMYLAASVILCDEMLKSYVSPIESFNNDQQIGKRCGFTSVNPDYEMLMPVVFDLKHGIELYLKALIMQVNSNQEYPIEHDLINLLNYLIRELMGGINHSKGDITVLDKNLREIIEKYYFGLYAFTQQKAYPDVNNEAERYPEHRNNNCYKIENLHALPMNELLQKIKNDCVVLQQCFREDILKKID